MERREALAGELDAKREELLKELAGLDGEIANLTGGATSAPGRPGRKKAGRRRGRPAGSRSATTRKKAAGARKKTTRVRRRATAKAAGGRAGRKSLSDYLHDALTGRTLSVSEVTDAVLKNGYPSKSPNLRTMVNQQLTANPKRFKRVARGEYTAK